MNPLNDDFEPIPVGFVTHRLKVAVAIEGDLVEIFKGNLERTLERWHNRLMLAIYTRSGKPYFTSLKRDALKVFRDLNLDWTTDALEACPHNQHVAILRFAIVQFYANYYNKKDFGEILYDKILNYVLNYLNRDEVVQQLDELVSQDWLMDLFEERGFEVIRNLKYPADAPPQN